MIPSWTKVLSGFKLSGLTIPVDINPNTTYLLGIGSNDSAGSEIEIEIKITVPPANDEPSVHCQSPFRGTFRFCLKRCLWMGILIE